jgi:hypothetical protein
VGEIRGCDKGNLEIRERLELSKNRTQILVRAVGLGLLTGV